MLTIIHIIVSIILIVLILLQDRSTGTSGLFGGTAADSSYQTRRGFEKFIFVGTIVFSALFGIIALINLTAPKI
ncbi:preprotein translocase subunit SecG [Candidatus Parcubacteria bacterium]|jgi:protein translocase SecG subunit|nr:MAG: preprotein translocase subunit SecG [Candidatus Parcubacteria bacterium]